MDSEEARQKTVIVTGAGRGIGAAIATSLAELGAKVTISDIDAENLARSAEAIAEKGGEILAVECDVRSEASTRALVDASVRRFGKVDALINCAGAYRLASMAHETTEEQWDLVIDSNLKGTFLCCKAVIPHMLQNDGGRIVNFASSAARAAGMTLGVEYTAAKSGILGLSRYLAKQYAQHNILVNTIAPGPITGPRFDETKSPQHAKRILENIPVKRFGSFDDIVPAVLFLISKQSSFVVGATLDVNGGVVMS